MAAEASDLEMHLDRSATERGIGHVPDVAAVDMARSVAARGAASTAAGAVGVNVDDGVGDEHLIHVQAGEVRKQTRPAQRRTSRRTCGFEVAAPEGSTGSAQGPSRIRCTVPVPEPFYLTFNTHLTSRPSNGSATSSVCHLHLTSNQAK